MNVSRFGSLQATAKATEYTQFDSTQSKVRFPIEDRFSCRKFLIARKNVETWCFRAMNTER